MIFLKKYLLVILITSTLQMQAEKLNSVARTMALSGCNVVMTSDMSPGENIASSVNSGFTGFSISHQLNYFIKELSVSTLQYSHSLNDRSFIDSKVEYSGNGNLSSANLQIGYGKKLGERISGGIKLNYNRLQYSDPMYSDLSAITAAICVFARATDKIHFGCIIDNPTRTKITSEQNLPAIVIGGLSYLPSDKIKVGLIAVQESGMPMNYCLGIEYALLKEIELRFSYRSNGDVMSGGGSFLLKKLKIEFGFSIQSATGNSSALTFVIPVK